ncbi:helix-turn-helix domain-containing protein [Actinomadura rudentiformis]|uniref:Helix-turn-helix transcriptional regulator n=1 Tax=Actinomadura rudentiformis TaxID=359158 RepID=A0A6H9YKJ1_9ACTN|nr:helix-turn-helix transcriptional regulator [Actinomadura rudentiformis]KAB2347738.1 helix-turn-helix transcriptional regulator [Actinomadura rudentiformis]
MTRREIFDPGAVPEAFWRRQEVQHALAHRDVGLVFRLFLNEFDDCTQTQLATLTGHDRSDISAWVSGTRPGQVSDVEVLTRIADSLQIPDQARLLLGLDSAGPVDIDVDLAGPWHDPTE